jgi:tetratricopeptide (TPR) repeat protein
MDSALAWCESESYWYYYLTAVKNVQINNYEKVIATINALLNKHTLTHPQLAVNYYDLGNAYKGMNNSEKCIQYTIMSSLSDIRTANKETAAMYTLARLLYEHGDVKNAYTFIKQAVDDAAFYGAHQRMAEIGHILPVIASAEVNNAESKGQLWLRYVIGLSILSLLVMLFAFIIFNQLRKLKAAELRIKQANRTLQDINQKLTEANRIKEEYLGYYFSINSEYVDKIESFWWSGPCAWRTGGACGSPSPARAVTCTPKYCRSSARCWPRCSTARRACSTGVSIPGPRTPFATAGPCSQRPPAVRGSCWTADAERGRG